MITVSDLNEFLRGIDRRSHPAGRSPLSSFMGPWRELTEGADRTTLTRQLFGAGLDEEAEADSFITFQLEVHLILQYSYLSEIIRVRLKRIYNLRVEDSTESDSERNNYSTNFGALYLIMDPSSTK